MRKFKILKEFRLPYGRESFTQGQQVELTDEQYKYAVSLLGVDKVNICLELL